MLIWCGISPWFLLIEIEIYDIWLVLNNLMLNGELFIRNWKNAHLTILARMLRIVPGAKLLLQNISYSYRLQWNNSSVAPWMLEANIVPISVAPGINLGVGRLAFIFLCICICPLESFELEDHVLVLWANSCRIPTI